MTDTTIVWLHGDCLSPNNPALLAYPTAPALFVFDDALLSEWQISLKRIVFIYECLLELPVTIRRGDVATELTAFAAEHRATHIATTESPSPRFAALVRALQPAHRIEILPVDPFLSHPGPYDLKRFSRYWRAAEPHAFGE